MQMHRTCLLYCSITGICIEAWIRIWFTKFSPAFPCIYTDWNWIWQYITVHSKSLSCIWMHHAIVLHTECVHQETVKGSFLLRFLEYGFMDRFKTWSHITSDDHQQISLNTSSEISLWTEWFFQTPAYLCRTVTASVSALLLHTAVFQPMLISLAKTDLLCLLLHFLSKSCQIWPIIFLCTC